MATTERSFNVASRWSALSAIVPGVFAAFAIVVSLIALVAGQLQFFQRYWVMLAIMGVGGLVGVYPVLTFTRTIVLRESEATFIGFRHEVVVRRGEALSLKPGGFQGTFELRSSSGRAIFPSRFTGFHEVVGTLKAQNPGMTIKDC